MTDVNALLKALGNPNAATADAGISTDPIFEPIDTGSYILNAMLSGSIYGGIPANKVTALAGEQGVGKTFFALSTAKAFLDKYPDGIFTYLDTEASTTREMLADRIGHLDRIIVAPVVTVQEISTQLSNLLSHVQKVRKKDKKFRMLIVLDSMGNLSTTKELEDIDAGTGTKDMTRAQLLKGAFRALTVKFAMAQTPLLFTNHTYQGMGMFASKTMSGGGGPLFAASQIIFLTKKKISKGSGMKQEKVGNIINMTNFKARGTKEGAKAATRLFFDTGLDRYYGLLDIAKKHQVWPVKDGQCVINGDKVPGTEIEANPEKYFTPEVLTLIDEACKKEFLYGQGDDEAHDMFDDEDPNYVLAYAGLADVM